MKKYITLIFIAFFVQNAFAAKPKLFSSKKVKTTEDVRSINVAEEFTAAPLWMSMGSEYEFIAKNPFDTVRHEYSAYLLGGLSKLSYAPGVSAFNKRLFDLGGGFGINYTYMFKPLQGKSRPKLGISLGLEVVSYSGKVSSGQWENAYPYQIPYMDDEGEGVINGTKTHIFEAFKETQNVSFLQIPIMAQCLFRVPAFNWKFLTEERDFKIHTAIGVKPGIAIFTKYTQDASGGTNYMSEKTGYLYEVGHGFGPFSYSVQGNMAVNFNVAASVEAGVRWNLSDLFAFYASLYCDYGFLNINPSNPPKHIRSDEPSYLGNNIFSTELVDNVNTVAAGLKVRFAFCNAKALQKLFELPPPSRAYLRIAIRDAYTNDQIDADVSVTDNIAGVSVDSSAIYDIDEANYRVVLPRNCDYTIAVSVKLPAGTIPVAVSGAAEEEKSADTDTSKGVLRANVILKDAATGQPLGAMLSLKNINNATQKTINIANTGGEVIIRDVAGSFNHLVYAVETKKSATNPFGRTRPNAKFIVTDDMFDTENNLSTMDKLQEVVEFLQQHTEIQIEVSGHTDNVASAKENMAASKKRAQSVSDYLIEQKIEKSRIKTVGKGASNPIADNKKIEGQASNRRVEITITEIKTAKSSKKKPAAVKQAKPRKAKTVKPKTTTKAPKK